jgi:hypothetical protein
MMRVGESPGRPGGSGRPLSLGGVAEPAGCAWPRRAGLGGDVGVRRGGEGEDGEGEDDDGALDGVQQWRLPDSDALALTQLAHGYLLT